MNLIKQLLESMDRDEASEWLSQHFKTSFFGKYHPEKLVNDDGKLVYKGDLEIELETEKEFPFILDRCQELNLRAEHLESFATMPRNMQSFKFMDAGNIAIKSLKGLGKVEQLNINGCGGLSDISELKSIIPEDGIADIIDCNLGNDCFQYFPATPKRINLRLNNKITSLKGIHKHIKKCKVIGLPHNVKDSILGLLMIEGIGDLEMEAMTAFVEKDMGSKEYVKALGILRKHIGKGKQGILDAQNELIDNDLDDYAEA